MRTKDGFTPLLENRIAQRVLSMCQRLRNIQPVVMGDIPGTHPKTMRFFSTGFTIIELMVVVAIIGLIAAVALGLFAKPKAQSRDARREKDMKEVRTGLNLYINTVGTYPVCGLGSLAGDTTCSGESLEAILRAGGAMSAAPRDPLESGSCAGFGASSFNYCYESAAGTDYALYYHLETDTIANPSGIAVPGSPGWYFISP